MDRFGNAIGAGMLLSSDRAQRKNLGVHFWEIWRREAAGQRLPRSVVHWVQPKSWDLIKRPNDKKVASNPLVTLSKRLKTHKVKPSLETTGFVSLTHPIKGGHSPKRGLNFNGLWKETPRKVSFAIGNEPCSPTWDRQEMVSRSALPGSGGRIAVGRSLECQACPTRSRTLSGKLSARVEDPD